MCRFFLSFGDPPFIFRRSFIEISRQDKTKGWSHGSGWGVLYARDGEFGVIKSVKPIWESYREPPGGYAVYLFHSRLASVGSISLANTHPIIYGDFAIAHNGTIDRVKLEGELRAMGIDTSTGGSTDTELFLKAFVELGADIRALRQTAEVAIKYLDPEEPVLNVALVDLKRVEAHVFTYRLVEDPHFIPVVHKGDAIVVASEPLSSEGWAPLANGTLITISREGVKSEILIH